MKTSRLKNILMNDKRLIISSMSGNGLPLERQKILIVDDKKENIVALRQILEEIDADIVEALDGNSALASTIDQDFSLALLDVRMPGMNGYELASFLHGDEKTRLMPIIFLTASYSDENSEFKGYEAGAIDYINKPFNPQVLLGKVRLFLELDKNKRELRQHHDHLETLVAARTWQLRERVKEVRCLYSISNLVARPGETLDGIMSAAVKFIPPGWQYPDITCAKITYEGDEYVTEDFKVTPWMQSTDIMYEGKKVGTVEVGYLQEKPEFDEGPFLKEERDLIIDISRQLGVAIQREKAADSLRKIEWMLQSGHWLESTVENSTPEYGNLLELNEKGCILHSVGSEMLEDIARDYLDLLDTSAAIYEKNGDYALGIFSSGWCRFLDTASRRLCGDLDNSEALECGKWLCHESCWRAASKACIEQGKPVDVSCHGGLRLYAVPVKSGDEVVGAINFGYGDPPRDRESLKRIAKNYNVDVDELASYAKAYETRPPYIIEMAKHRLHASARLIGEIVNRKHAESERLDLEEELRQAQKLDAIGQLAGGVAHDFNNQLSVIMGYAELLNGMIAGNETGEKYVSVIMNSATKSAELTRQLLTFARKSAHKKVPAGIHKIVGEVVEMVRRTIDPRIEVRVDLAAEIDTIRGDQALLQNAILNMCINARDAMDDGGAITLATSNIEPDDSPGDIKEQSILLSISDTGMGMSEETIERIFEPFFTTKEVGKGTGMGLAAVYGTVKSHGGVIEVDSQLNKGTTFKLYFPVTTVEDKDIDAATFLEIVEGKGRVMIVDDEDGVRDMVCDMLESLGYSIACACTNGEEAVKVYSEKHKDIDMVLMDMQMPRMNGADAFGKMKECNPDIVAMIMSGYGDGFSEKQYLDLGFAGVMSKPFTRASISNAIAVALKQTVS